MINYNGGKFMAKKTKTELSSPKEQELKTASYRLKALMNVRKLPSLEAEIVAHAQKDKTFSETNFSYDVENYVNHILIKKFL